MIRFLLVSLLLCACSDNQEAAVPDATPDCSLDSRAQVFSAGMSAMADDGVQVVLVSALPAPPVRFDNEWSVQILDAQGEALDVTELQVEPFMPDHGHGTPEPPMPVAGQELGDWEMGPFDLWMPGIWEVRFAIVHAGTTSIAVLTLCIEE